MKLEVLKAVILVVMLACTFLCSMAPLTFVSIARREMSFNKRSVLIRSVGLLSCFAGGVFMGTCLLDLFPDVRDKLSTVFDSMNWFSSFPVAEFVMAFGFFLVLIIEQITLSCKESGVVMSGIGHGHSHQPRSLLSTRSHKSSILDKSQVQRSSYLLTNNEEHEPDIMHTPTSNKVSTETGGRTPMLNVLPPTPTTEAPDDVNTPLLEAERKRTCHQSCTKRCCKPLPSIVGISDQPCPVSVSDTSVFYGPAEIGSENGNADESVVAHSFSRSMILVLALSVHSIFEGMAVGLQSTAQSVIDIFTALILHKCVLAFSLGLNLIQSDLSLFGMLKSNLIFSIMSPLGIGIGMGITDGDSNHSTALAAGLLQGIACGTFIYVTFFEVLPHEMNSSQDRLLKVLCLIVGFSAVCGLLMLHTNIVRPTCYRGAEPV